MQSLIVVGEFLQRRQSLEDEPWDRALTSLEAGHWKLTTTNWEPSSKLILLQLHKKLPKNAMSTTLCSFGIWSKLERWISSTSGCLVSWLQIKKVVILKCHLLLFYATKVNHFSIRLWCEIKSGLNRTIGNDQLSGSTEKKLQSTSQSQTCTKKRVLVTVWWFAARLIY